MRKLVKSLAWIMACALLATGCGGSGGSGGGSAPAAGGGAASGGGGGGGEKVTLTFSWWGSDNRHEAIQDVIALYEAENPNVMINVEYGAWTDWSTKIITQLSGKTEADILQVNYNWVHSFGKGTNVFADLSKYSDVLDLSNWDQEYLDAMTVGGELAAVPHGMNGRIYFYNKTMFDDVGIAYPTTYDEMIEVSKVIAADNTPTGDNNKYAMISLGKESPDLYIAQMLYNETGKIMQVDGKIQYTAEEVAAVLEKYKSFGEAGFMPTFQQEDPLENESNPVWTSGRAGSTYEWGSAIDKFITAYKGGGHDDEIGVAPYIVPKAGMEPTIYVKPNLGYAISKNCKNPEVAADFLNFYFTNEEAVKTLGTTIGISSNKVTKEIQERENMISPLAVEGYAMLDSYKQIVMDPYFEDSNVRGERYTAVEAYRSGRTSAAEAAKDYVERQQAELDKLYK